MAGLLAAALACAPLPVSLAQSRLPDLQDESASVLSPQTERRIGEAYYRELRGEPDYLDDPEVTAYVQELGARLIAASENPSLDVEFFLIRDSSINAFAMIGGYIGVNSGLLLAAQSESEVASVLGHEIGHLIQKHLARAISANKKTSMMSLVGAAFCLLAARSHPDAVGACSMAASAVPISEQLRYSRDFEREADRVGFDILKKGGFDVSAMPVFFERLDRAGRVYEGNIPVYVRSHPLTVERIADVRNRVQAAPYRQHADPLAFHLVRAKLRATLAAGVDERAEALRYFSTQIKDQAYANLPAALYGHAWALLQNRDPAGAEAELAKIPKSVTHPMFESLAAAIRQARGDTAGAATLLRAAVAKYPRQRYLQLYYIEALQKANRHEEALVLLREQLQLYRGEPRLYALQVKSFGATGKKMSQHQAQGEYNVLLGRYQPAIDELMVARCAGDGDFYQQSIIDSRIRAVWEQMLDSRRDENNGKEDKARGKPMPQGRAPEARCS
jgi:predicted Zn-dependent protease